MPAVTESEVVSQMRSVVRAFAQREIPPYLNLTSVQFPRELFHKSAKLGLCGLAIPEEFGGISASAEMSAAVYTELAAVNLGPAIFLSVHNMVCSLITKFGSPEQKSLYLPSLASGEMLAAFALTEPGAGSNASALRSTAVLDNSGDMYTLNGEKCWITSAGFADLYLSFARTSGEQGERKGISAFLVLASDSGLHCATPEVKMGCELSPIASVSFVDCQLPAARGMGTVGEGYAIALGGLASGRINIAACANGLARASIQKAYQFLSERKQFGQLLVEFQGLQFMLADMQMRLEAAELLTINAARTLDRDPESRENRLQPSIAKCFATDAAMQTCTDAVQLLGGAGYVREYEVERFMRDAKMLQIVEGTNQIQRQIIAQEMKIRLK
jgi:alkylation response protein AidB-like acyl-CoA dehydrogenase